MRAPTAPLFLTLMPHVMHVWEGNKGGRSLGRARGHHRYRPGCPDPTSAYWQACTKRFKSKKAVWCFVALPVYAGGKLTFLLCMVLGLLGPSCQEEYVLTVFLTAEEDNDVQEFSPAQFGSSTMGVLKIRAEIHCDILKSVQALHTPFPHAAPRLLPHEQWCKVLPSLFCRSAWSPLQEREQKGTSETGQGAVQHSWNARM